MKICMLFTPYDEFYDLGNFSFCYVCDFLLIFIQCFLLDCVRCLSALESFSI